MTEDQLNEMLLPVGHMVLGGGANYDPKIPEQFNAMKIRVAKFLQKEGYSITEFMSSYEEIKYNKKLDDETYNKIIEIDKLAKAELLNDSL
jgi:hypothetical protein